MKKFLLSLMLAISFMSVNAQILQRGSVTFMTADRLVNNTSQLSLTINKPTGLAVGDLMLLQIIQSGNDATILDVIPTGWALNAGSNIRNTNQGQGGNFDRCRATLVYKFASSTDVSALNFQFNLDSNTDTGEGAIVAFSGVDTNFPFDSLSPIVYEPFANTSSNSLNASSITTNNTLSAIIMFGVVENNSNISNWTTANSGTLIPLYNLPYNGSRKIGMGAAWKIKSDIGPTGLATASVSNGNNYNGAKLLALRAAPVGPTLFVTPIALDFGIVPNGNNSLAQNYVLSGTNLNPGPITINAPANFEVSLSSESGYASSLNITNIGGTLSNTNIYVRFNPSSSNTNYSGNISNTGGGATIKNVSVQGTSITPTNCNASSNNSAVYITNVQINTINYTSEATTYSNFRHISTDLKRGDSYPLTISRSNNNQGQSNWGYAVWIDYNFDGDFLDAGEQVFTQSLTQNLQVGGTVSIPTNGYIGFATMRVAMQRDAIPNDCGSFGFGEVEDYTINLLPACALPVARCQNIDLSLDANGTAILTPQQIDNANNLSTYECGLATMVVSKTNFNCSNLGQNNVTLTITDVNGAISTCTSTVTVIDNLPPVVPSNGSLTVSCIANAVTPSVPNAIDNCGPISGVLVSTIDTPSSITCEGTRVYTYSYSDGTNTVNWTFTYTIEYDDFTAPSPTNETVACYGNIQLPTPPAVTDNCGTVLIPTEPVESIVPECEGDITYTWTYTDCEGNTHDYVHTVTIERLDFTIATPNGSSVVNCASLAVAPTLPTVKDNCNNTITPTGPSITGTYTTCEGTIIYTYNYADCEGNNHDWKYTYTITRTGAPTIINCPSTVTVATGTVNANCSQTATWAPPTATTSCGEVANVSSSHSPGATFPVGTTPVTYTFTDCAGNLSTCSFNVVVNDTTPPTIICPINIVLSACELTPTWTPVANDHCSGVMITQTAGLGSTFEPGTTTTITYKATDAAGNSTSCSFTVTRTAEIELTTTQTNVSCNGGNNGAIDLTASGGAVTSQPTITRVVNQNFNTLTTSASSTWVDNSTILGWYSQRTGNGTTIVADGGTNTGGNLYSYGTDTNTERALGTIGSGNSAAGHYAHGVLVQNTTGSNVTNVKVSYTLEQWRNSAAASQAITVYYKTSNSSITDLTPNNNSGWTSVTVLNASSPITNGTAGSKDGNNALNRVVKANINIPGLTLTNNQYLMIKWEDPDHSGADHGLAIDDVSVDFTYTPSGYTYYWSPGDATIEDISGLTAGTYTVTVTDANGCTAQKDVTITEPTAITGSAEVTSNYNGAQISCPDSTNGQITVNATGGTGTLTYSKNDGATYQASNVFNNLGAGKYTITVKDANNCVVSLDPVTIKAPTAIIGSVEVTSYYNGWDISCVDSTDGVITVTASNGTGALQYSINSTTVYQSSNIFSGLGAATYTLRVRDANLCLVRLTDVTIAAPPAISGSGSVTSNYNGSQISCPGSSDGVITVTSGGGTGDLTFSKDGGTTYQTSNIFSGLQSGTYQIRIKDDNNCVRIAPDVTITAPTAISGSGAVTSNYNGAQLSCHNSTDGEITVTAAGGSGTKTYSKDGGSNYQSSNIFSGLGAGSYAMFVKDANNCIYNAGSVTITAPTEISISETVTNATCNGESNGAITLNVSGGTPNPVGTSQTETENFNTLATTGTNITWVDNVTIAKFYSNRTTYIAGTGSSATGALYSLGVAGNTDRALGSVASNGTGSIYSAWKLTNNTGVTVKSLTLNYTGEQWRNGGNSAAQMLSFDYQVNASGINSGTWIPNTALDFTSLINTASSTDLDGNAAANRAAKSATITVDIPAGQSIWLRWTDENDSGTDHGLAIDDLSATFNLPSSTPYTYSWSATNGGQVLSGQTNNQNLTGLKAGTYAVTITDANGCIKQQSFEVAEPIEVTLSETHTGASCLENTDGTISATASAGATITVNGNPYNPNATYGVGTYTLVASAPNGNNNGVCTTSKVVNIVVDDQTAPVVITQDVTVYLDASGQGSTTAAAVNNGSSDACGIQSMVLSQTEFSCSHLGPNTVTLTVTDVNDNEADGNATVTVVDNIIPVINGTPGNIVMSNDNGRCDAVVNWTAATVADNCTGATINSDYQSGDTFPLGTTTVTYNAVDVAGNNAVATLFTVTVNDTEAPIAICPADIVVSNDSGDCGAIVNFTPTFTDNCIGGNVVASPPSGSFFDKGTTEVTVTATDAAGNSHSCTFSVTVNDTEAPVIACQDLQVYLNASGTGSITAEQITQFATDNCEIASVSISQTNFNCSDIGGDLDDLIISEYIDGSGFENYIELFNGTGVTVNLTEYSLLVYYDGSSTPTAYPLGGTIDDRTVSVISHPSALYSGVLANNTVLLNFDGNDAIALSHNGTIVDLLPVYTSGVSLLDTTLRRKQEVNNGNVSSGSGSDGWSQYSNTVVGNLGSHTIIFSDNENNVELTVTDTSGNTSTCIASVAVIDNTPPVVACQNITVQLNASGDVSITADDVELSSSDACGIASLTLDIYDFTCANVGANVVTLTATDRNGNSSTCTATVTVEDNVPPVAAAQDFTVELDANGNANITPQQIDNGSTDACGILSITVSPDTFDCSNVGNNNTVTLTVTDNNNNVSTATATVTVRDNIAPVAACQNITVALDANGFASIIGSDVDGGSTDACGIASYSVSVTEFNCSNIGANNVVLTVKDVNGNISTCDAVVTVTGIVPTVTISQSALPEFCQGAVVVLTANTSQPQSDIRSYAWSGAGVTLPTDGQSVSVSDNGIYTVEVTSETNCTTTATFEVKGFDAGTLISSYTILAIDEVFLHGSNLVQTGAVGAKTPGTGTIKLHQATTVVGFAQASNILLNQGSTVTTAIYQPATPTIPTFLFNTQSMTSSPNVTVNNNQTQSLTGSVYNVITIKQGATVTFTQPNVYINEIRTFENATINFDGCTNVYLNEKLMLARGGKINTTGKNVVIYVNDDVQIEQGSNVRARIHLNGNEILAKGANANGNNAAEPTYMTGLFIASRVHGNKNVIWNADPVCAPCSNSSGGAQPPVANNGFRIAMFTVSAWPNPSNTEFNIKLISENLSDKVVIKVFDMNNKLVHSSEFGATETYRFGKELQGGVYLIKLMQDKNMAIERLIKY